MSEFSFFNENRSTRFFCSKFFSDPGNPVLCEGCGYTEKEHVKIPKKYLGPWQNAQSWRADLHRVHLPRASGPTPTHEIEFVDQNEGIQKKAQLSILAVDTHPNLFMEVLLENWKLQKPDIVISVSGTSNHVNLRRQEFNAFQTGLVKVVSTTKCWVITGGTNDGVDELVSRALKEVQYLKWLGKTKVNFDLIAINNWNCVAENRNMSTFWSGDSLPTPTQHRVLSHIYRPVLNSNLASGNNFQQNRNSRRDTSVRTMTIRDKVYKYLVKKTRSNNSTKDSDVSPKGSNANLDSEIVYERYETHLNPIFTHFLAIECAVREKHGELPARIAIENFCSKSEKLVSKFQSENSPLTTLNTPTVLLVVGGDAKTLEHMANSVNNGIPVVLCQGSGGIVDYLIVLLSKIPESVDFNVWPQYMMWVRKVLGHLCKEKSENDLFNFNHIDSVSLQPLLFKCLQRRKLFKIYKLTNPVVNLQTCIFSALLDGQTAKSHDPVRLALQWNYCGDLIESILVRETDINLRKDINDHMMESIEHEDKIQFTRLFLQCGFTMEKFLSPKRLAQLYERSYRMSPVMSHFVEYRLGTSEQLQLSDIYDVCYMCTTSKPVHTLKVNNSFLDPYRELFIWALISGRLKASEFFWMYASNQLILALIGSELLKSLARSLTGDLVELEGAYLEASEQYTQKAYDILDSAWELNQEKAMSLLDTKLPHYGNINVIDVAWFIEAKIVISHPCFQRLVQHQWTNELNCYHAKVLTTLVNPFSVLYLKSTKESNMSKVSGHTVVIPWSELKQTRQVPPPALCSLIAHDSFDELHDQVDDALYLDRKLQSERCVSMDFDYKFGDPISKDTLRHAWVLWKRKARLFYFSPACKFMIRLIFHLMFVLLLSKFYLFELHYMRHGWLEYYIALYYVSTILEIFCGFWLKTNMELFSLKWRVWKRAEWNFLDVTVSVIGLTAFLAVPVQKWIVKDEVYHVDDSLPNMRKGFYALATLLSWIKILRYYQYEKKLGTVWIMIRNMLKETMIFMSILVVFLCSFGVFFTSIFELFGYEDAYSGSYLGVILRSFFIINGEYFLETFDETVSSGDHSAEKLEELTRLKSYYVMIVIIMLFIGNAMLLNTLIAIFGSIYATIMNISDEEWKTERFTMVREFQSRSFFPHPFCIIVSLTEIIRHFTGIKTTKDYTTVNNQKAANPQNSDQKSELDKFEHVVVQTMLRNKSELVTKDYLIEQSLKCKDTLLDRINHLSGNLEKMRKTKGDGKIQL